VLATIFHHAAGLIATSSSVRDRLLIEMKKRNLPAIPVLVASLPLSPGFNLRRQFNADYENMRYVVMVGTIEPRKNHWLMLQLWRQMIRNGDNPPKLVIIGARGWGSEAIYDMLNRTPEFAGHVLHLTDLSNEGLRQIIGHARALLMPSFVEGYGIPIIEAAALGTPVITGNHRVFAEVSQRLAVTIDPMDGPGWRHAILSKAGPKSKKRKPLIAPLPGFDPPQIDPYFDRVRAFLAEL
jgi:glycosyltransferase involved in cell wall biosynthesis